MKISELKLFPLLLILSALQFSGCAVLFSSDSEIKSISAQNNFDRHADSKWVSSGSLSYGGPIVAVKSEASGNEDYQDKAYGFAAGGLRTLRIELSKKLVTLSVGGSELARTQLLDSSGLTPGNFNVAHKQRNPLWYAPDQYFTARNMSVPGEGDKLRFLRGAYGDFAIFINPEEAIHSGPFALNEINGVRCQEKDLAKIFYSMEIGDSIIVSE